MFYAYCILFGRKMQYFFEIFIFLFSNGFGFGFFLAAAALKAFDKI